MTDGTALDTGWTVSSAGRPPRAVTLPHDAMIHERRDPRVKSGPASGFYPGGTYTYRRDLEASEEWRGRHVSLVFEGVYRRARVLLNGVEIASRPSGYAEFAVDLDAHLRYGERNVLDVVADTSQLPDARWYSGAGLYRRVWLHVRGATRLVADGVRVRTVSAGDPARVEVEVAAVSDTEGAIAVEVELRRDGRTVATGDAAAVSGAPSVVGLDVTTPALWSAEAPHLYDLAVRLDGQVVHTSRVGIRTVTASAAQGLLVNGVPTKLRGGCLHHDSGVLGSATFRDAEFRRVRILKEVGFNALRSGHTPMSRDLLDACDELGVYVMDELTDVWFKPKSPHDSGRDFPDWWRRDLGSMIAKDRNHASVIFYSIGNENGETATEEGIAVGREMVALCHELDPTRLVTAGINPFLNALASFGVGLLNMDKEVEPDDIPKMANSTLINHLMNALNDRVLNRPRLPRFDTATRGVFAELDVAGYNYGVGQYELHARRYPERILVGTETNPKDIVRNWNLVEKHPYLLGDFMWTAMDYLGEAGIGSWTYGADRVGLIKPYPWLTADCGAVDLIGTVTAAGRLAGAAWGRVEPSIVARPPHLVAQKELRSNWRGTDAIASWSWPGSEKARTRVLVYSAAPVVELFQDGRSLGRRPAGPRHGCTAEFPVVYEPGELVAVAYDGRGAEVGRSGLRTAGDVALHVEADRVALATGEQDLAFATVRLADRDGVVLPTTGVALRATVDGAASLAGFGSADPRAPGDFVSGSTATFHGRALAVVRAGAEPGEAVLTIAADGYGEQRVAFTIR